MEKLLQYCRRLLLVGLMIPIGGHFPCASASQSVMVPSRILGQGTVTGLAIAPDLRTIASVGPGGAFLWSLTTGQQTQQLRHGKDFLYQAHFTADSSRLITVGSARSTVWDLKTQTVVGNMVGDLGHSSTFSESGRQLLLLKQSEAQLWDTDLVQRVKTLNHPMIRAVDMNSSGTLAVTAGEDRRAVLWDLTTLQETRTLPHSGPLFFAAFSPDASKLVTAGRGTLWIWDVATGDQLEQIELTRTGFLGQDNLTLATKGTDRNAHLWLTNPANKLFDLTANPRPLETVQFSPGDTWVVGGGRESIWLWDPATGELAQEVVGHSPVFSPDGLVFLARKGNGRFELWETNPPGSIRLFEGHTDGRTFGRYFPSDDSVAFVDGPKLTIYDGQGQVLHRFSEHEGRITSIDITDDQTSLLSAAVDRRVILWDLSNGSPRQTLELAAGPVYVSFLPESQQPLIVSDDGRTNIWASDLSQVVEAFAEHDGATHSVDILAEHQLIALADENGVITVRDAKSFEVGRTFQVEEEIFSISLAPDGTRLFVGTRLGPSYLFDLTSGNPPQSMDTGPAWRTEISPDGQSVLIAGATVWDLNTGRLRFELKLDDRLGANADLVRYSPDGRLIGGTGSVHDASARVWDAYTGKLLYAFDRHEGAPTHLEFSPDSQQLLTTASDGRAMIWQLDPGPNLRIRRQLGSVTLDWKEGTLESAHSLEGPWLPVDAPSPFSPSEGQAQGFFRIALPEPNR